MGSLGGIGRVSTGRVHGGAHWGGLEGASRVKEGSQGLQEGKGALSPISGDQGLF